MRACDDGGMDVLIGVLAVALGLLLCFRGSALARVLLALWGSFVGFWLGAAAVAASTDQPALDGLWGWVGAIVGAVLLALLAYWFYVLAVIIWLGSLGFALATALAHTLGASDLWAMVIGAVAAVALAVLGLVLRLPAMLLAVLTALAGASLTLGGVLILIGQAPAGPAPAEIAWPEQWWWTALYLVLAAAGIITQGRTRARRDARTHWQRSPSAADR